MNALGIHIIADLLGCNKKILKDPQKTKAIAEGAAREAHATIMDTRIAENPQDIGVRVIIAESHISIFPAPKYGLACVEVFACGDVIDPSAAVIYIAKKLKSKIALSVKWASFPSARNFLTKPASQLQPEKLDSR